MTSDFSLSKELETILSDEFRKTYAKSSIIQQAVSSIDWDRLNTRMVEVEYDTALPTSLRYAPEAEPQPVSIDPEVWARRGYTPLRAPQTTIHLKDTPLARQIFVRRKRKV